jgi:GntR family transcriptional repressor for pyruvate dehydrogenase complex
MIAERHLSPGDRLPSERDLALQFNVSRTVIREAVAALSAKSLLEPQANGGAIVRTPSAESVSQSLAMFLNTGLVELDYGKVNEVRRLLEVEIAALAAARRTDADLASLESIVANTEASSKDRHEFAANDTEFHMALARATQNELFVLLMESMSRILFLVRETGFDVPGISERALFHHKAILESVRNGDAVLSANAMSAHLAEAEQTQAEVTKHRKS